MARTATAETLAGHVYAEIRSEILQGGFVPGERLKPSELRVRFGVSVSVIREALSRLAEQRLVCAEQNQGFHVTPLTDKDLLDLTDIRVVVEGYALRQAIARGDKTWESRVVAAHYLLSVTPLQTDPEIQGTSEEWSAVHRDFHRCLTEACDMPVLLGMCDTLFDASELYRRLSAHYTVDRDILGEHRALMEAAISRDADVAVRLLEEHFRLTTTVLRQGLKIVVDAAAAS